MANKGKTYTAAQIKVQSEKYEKAHARYMKAVAKKAPTRENKKRAEELFSKAADEFEKLQEMRANRKRK